MIETNNQKKQEPNIVSDFNPYYLEEQKSYEGSKDERNESSEEQRRKQIKEKARYRDPDNTKPNENEFQTKTCPESDREITKTSKRAQEPILLMIEKNKELQQT